jgi:hypothetical protein
MVLRWSGATRRIWFDFNASMASGSLGQETSSAPSCLKRGLKLERRHYLTS